MPKTYCPKKHTPTLPLSQNFMENRKYVAVAWHVYWKMCQNAKGENLLEKHRLLQKMHPFTPPDTDNVNNGHYWSTDDFLVLFMLQFEDWQNKKYDIEYITSVRPHQLIDLIDHTTTLDEVFNVLTNDWNRHDVLDIIYCRDAFDAVRELSEDPIFGHQARFEIRQNEWKKNYEIDEVFRRSALPENIQVIDKMLSKLGPTNYNVMFPYPKNEYHSYDNCLCVLGDGSMIFRLVVLDPEHCTRFTFVEMSKPWWKSYGLLGPCGPGEGEYDFPFYDLDISEGDELSLEKLIEVIERGSQQIMTRSERKWGKS